MQKAHFFTPYFFSLLSPAPPPSFWYAFQCFEQYVSPGLASLWGQNDFDLCWYHLQPLWSEDAMRES